MQSGFSNSTTASPTGGPKCARCGEIRLGLMLGFSFLAIVSMAGICLIIRIITSRGGEQLLATGFALFAAAVLHNLAGYFFGYWGARLSRLSETDCRTVAMNVLHSAGAGLAAVVFGPWMNISGAPLAEWWKRRPALVSNR